MAKFRDCRNQPAASAWAIASPSWEAAHIAELMTSDCRALIRESEVLVVGNRESSVTDLLRQEVRPSHVLLDLVNLPRRSELNCEYHGVCW